MQEHCFIRQYSHVGFCQAGATILLQVLEDDAQVSYLLTKSYQINERQVELKANYEKLRDIRIKIKEEYDNDVHLRSLSCRLKFQVQPLSEMTTI